MTQAPALRVQPGDPTYEDAARAEAAFWAAPHPFGIEAESQRDRPSAVDRYTNERFTGDPGRTWVEDIAHHGHFRKGLSLGASGIEQDARILETNPDLSLTIVDISADALRRWHDQLGARFPGRVTTQSLDLNFADLPPSAYDLIVSSSTLHHVQNLERLAWQINGALTTDGRFFLQDYCGENRYQFDARKRRVFELIYDRDLARRAGRPLALEWVREDDGGFSPFCASRSQDTLAVLAEYLVPDRVRGAGALIFPMMLARPTGDPGRAPLVPRIRLRVRRRWLRLRGQPSGRVDPVFFSELALIGDVLADAGVILPGNVYGIYRKRGENVG